jgi:predicted phage tail protein
MDKPALIQYIKDLKLGEEVTKFLVAHIEESELNQDLLERIAQALEMMAEAAEIYAETWEKELNVLEDYAKELTDIGAQEEEESRQLLSGFLDTVETIVKEAKNSVSAPTS